VLCPDRAVARKYRAIYQAPAWPRGALQPLIFTGADVPVITDLDLAAAEPSTTLFYTVCRARMPDVAATFPAVTTALSTTGEKHGWELAQEYDQVVSAALLEGPAAKLWEAFVSTATGREYRSRLWDDGVATGEARGEARGIALGEARGQAHGAAALGTAVLTLLGARHVPVTDAVRDKILACTDLAVAITWLSRAETATVAEEVVRP
jgi:hypothetical protein